jgi:hypothetical protein
VADLRGSESAEREREGADRATRCPNFEHPAQKDVRQGGDQRHVHDDGERIGVRDWQDVEEDASRVEERGLRIREEGRAQKRVRIPQREPSL